MPWNFPYYQVARFAAPNLMLGNTILLKHAPSCPQSALLMEEIFVEPGLPADAYVNVFATNDQIADMIADPRVHGVSLTGSERAGSASPRLPAVTSRRCAGTWRLRPVHRARHRRHGRHREGRHGAGSPTPARPATRPSDSSSPSLYDEFVAKLTASFEAIKPGDPSDPKTAIGPLSSQAAADLLTEQVSDTVDAGATLLTGGKPVDGPGAYVEPTLLADVAPGMRAYSEELFGPVGVVYKVAYEEEAVALANSTSYGLVGLGVEQRPRQGP